MFSQARRIPASIILLVAYTEATLNRWSLSFTIWINLTNKKVLTQKYYTFPAMPPKKCSSVNILNYWALTLYVPLLLLTKYYLVGSYVWHLLCVDKLMHNFPRSLYLPEIQNSWSHYSLCLGGLSVGLEIYKIAYIPALLNNSQTWMEIDTESEEKLEGLQCNFLRILLKLMKSDLVDEEFGRKE